ncbi:MAG TPA: S8 family serine peptidase, partial [Candidatus Eisenbacteria bacterium]|nr:S8 family serine peptidase [Candidatus Eisenbacteria bacterium]
MKLREAADARDGASVARPRSLEFDRLMRRYGLAAADPVLPARSPRARRPRSPHARARLEHYLVLRAPRAFDVAAAAEAFRSLPEVELAEPDYAVSQAGASANPTTSLPDDPGFATYQWGFRNTGDQTTDPASLPRVIGADIHATDAWAVTTGDPSVVVAVIDTGIRTDHSEFAGRIWVNEDEVPGNGLDDDGNGYVDDANGYNFYGGTPSPYDDGGHGTACASIIAANANNGSQLAGLDWSCRLMPLKVLAGSGGGLLSAVAASLVYAADNGADVASMSLGGYGLSSLLRDACAYAHDEGVFLAAAMMNDNSSQPAYPAAFDASVTAVGGSDAADDRCTLQVAGYGSNYGPHIDVVAPGVSIPVLVAGIPGGIDVGGGTSFSTPMVAGLASLLRSVNPGLAPDQIRDVIRYSAADQVGRPYEDTAGFDDYHGWGRIDCGKALALAAKSGFPAIVAPPLVRGAEGLPVRFDVAATDPDGDPFDSFQADLSRLPEAAAFTERDDHAGGTFAWAPSYADAGVYPVRFRATNPFEASAITEIEIFDVTDLPTVSAPGSLTGEEGAPLQAIVTAIDPDGDPLTRLASGPLPSGATFTVDPDQARGILAWTPSHAQAGNYVVTYTVTSLDPAGPLGEPLEERGSGLTRILVREGPPQPPVVTAPARVDGAEGAPLSIDLEASDADGDPITSFSAAPLPTGATFAVGEGNRTAMLAWTPDFQQAGAYEIRITAESAHRAAGVSEPVVTESSVLLSIAVAETPRAPTANAGGPYAGVVGIPIAFDGTASSDPDGTPLAGYVWRFGDGATGTGAAPSHAYATGGEFAVSLTVSDGALEATASASATVIDLFQARAFPAPQDRAIRLLSAKRDACLYLEPVDGSFEIGAIDLASVSLLSDGTGEVARIGSVAGKGATSGDADRNGVGDLAVCFAKNDLRRLFSYLHAGKQRVPVAIEASLVSGGRIRADLTIEVVASGGALAATMTPNPLRAGGVL